MHRNRVLVGLLLAVAMVAGTFVCLPSLVEHIAYAQARGEAKAQRENLSRLAREDHISPLFVAVAEAVKPAVVEVRVSKRVQVQAAPEMEEFMRRFFGERDPFGQSPFEDEDDRQMPRRRPRQPREFLQRGLGSGVIVDADEGYVLTNYHVVAGADEVTVVTADGRSLETEWIRSDPQTDLAVLRVNGGRNLVEAPLGDSDEAKVGQLVLAIGAPEGLPQTVTAGIISAKGRTTGRGGYENFLQTDASINRGNSGGPLVNMRGEVIGINAAIVSRTGVNEGIGFAIPANMARSVMNQLIETGKVVRGYLGIGFQDINERLAESFNIPTTRGTLVRQVMEDSPADDAGLEPGDFIIRVGEGRIASGNELRNTIADTRPGEKVELEFYREGERQTATVTLGEQPPELRVSPFGEEPERDEEPAEAERFGIQVQELTEQLARRLGLDEDVEGVVVVSVEPVSDAAQQGLSEGMVITQVDGKDVTTPGEFRRAIENRKNKAGVRLRVVNRRGMAQFVFVTPQAAQEED
jgi:serine protease Do